MNLNTTISDIIWKNSSTYTGTGFETKCKRCGRSGYILSNGYCSRCDNVLFRRVVK